MSIQSKQVSRLSNTRYRKDQIDRLKKRDFSSLPTTPATVVPGMTVEEFFELYEQLFFKIPPEGEFNSHRYLVNNSSSILNMDQDRLDIQPLLDEIASLREELLAAKTENLSQLGDQLKIKELAEGLGIITELPA